MDSGCVVVKNNYVDSMRLVLLSARLFGFLPFCHHKEGSAGYGFRWLSWSLVYSALIYSSIVYVYVKFVSDQFYNTVYTSLYNKIVIKSATIVWGTSLVFVPFTSWISVSRITNYWKRWQHFQDDLTEEFGSDFFVYPNKFTLPKRIFLVVELIVFWVAIQHTSFNWTLTFRSMYYTISGCYGWSWIAIWYAHCKYVEQCAEFIQGKLETTIRCDRRKQLRRSSIRRVTLLWMRLSELTDDFGTAYSPIYLINLVYVMMVLTVALYMMVVLFNTQFARYNLVILIASYNALNVFWYCDAAYRASRKVSFHTKRSILKNDLTTSTRQNMEDIVVFLHIISIKTTTMSMSDLMSINRNVYISILSTIITYIIVLRQFSLSSSA